MKIVSLTSKQVYDIDPRKSGENISTCPECDANRKHKGKKSFSWNNQKGIGFCQNCQAKFVVFKVREEKQYFVPEYRNITQLSEKAVSWFAGRAISQPTLAKMKIYSDQEFMPQENKSVSVICFPFFMDGKLINIKYRDGKKNFKLVKDAELLLYNIDALNNQSVVIVEGEIDCLSYIESGIDNCVSVPNGASTGRMEYLDNYIEAFETVEKVYIATDNDIPGIGLREELIRRIGAEKCLVVNFKDCKDANEYLIKYGGIELSQTIVNATEVPLEGVVNLSAYYDSIYQLYKDGMKPGCGIGRSDIDDLVTWETGRVAVGTGIPGHGKSEFVDYLVARLNILYGWKVGYFSPENYPLPIHYAKLASKLSGKAFQFPRLDADEYEQIFDYILDNFHFIIPEEDQTFESILLRAKYLVRKYGIKVFVIDPYNKIEHLRNRGETETEYISRFLDKVTMFARQYGVLVFLIAHPRKMEKSKDTGLYMKPNLYDINGSANFYNKCDYGFSVYRLYSENIVSVDFIKVKFRHLGPGGAVELKYNYNNGRYEHKDSTVDDWDNSNYLKHEPTPKQDLPLSTKWSNIEQIELPPNPNF